MIDENIPLRSLRLKITGNCNLTCFFCHEEGGMRGVQDADGNGTLSKAIERVSSELDIQKVNITGGEPCLNNNLPSILQTINQCSRISHITITTNGTIPYSVADWENLKNIGLSNVTFTVNFASQAAFDEGNNPPPPEQPFPMLFNNQKTNIKNSISAGLETRVNIVCCHSTENTLTVLNTLRPLMQKQALDVVLLNNIFDFKKSSTIIKETLLSGEFTEVSNFARPKSSNLVKKYLNKEGVSIYAKDIGEARLTSICSKCCQKERCEEGFYGLRIEKRGDSYYVRTCINRTANTLLSIESFLSSPLCEELKMVGEQHEQA